MSQRCRDTNTLSTHVKQHVVGFKSRHHLPHTASDGSGNIDLNPTWGANLNLKALLVTLRERLLRVRESLIFQLGILPRPRWRILARRRRGNT
ncbi:unnamed protein product [Linum trigynum]|uniref:Uncharacterized protein n=1 Tax=Linum trigynum TaxID=586398 RepID=A0AAV2GXT0_9ROSI